LIASVTFSLANFLCVIHYKVGVASFRVEKEMYLKNVSNILFTTKGEENGWEYVVSGIVCCFLQLKSNLKESL